MDPRLQSSFIPKKPILETGPVKYAGEVNVLLIVSVFVFAVALLAAAGLFILNSSAKKSTQAIAIQIQEIQQSLSPAEVQDLEDLSTRLSITKQLVDYHVAASEAFSLLEQNLNKNVRLKSLEYIYSDEGIVRMTSEAEAATFNSVAYQSDIFRANPAFIRPIFSDLELTDQNRVNFRFDTEISPDQLKYINRFGTTTPAAGATQ